MADLRDYTKKNIIFAGTDGIRLPTGNNAQRTATSNVAGTMRYNSDIGGLEVYSPNGWTPLAAPPTITTVTPSTFNGTSGTQFVVNGTNFTSDALVYFVTAQNIALLAASVTYISPVEIRATTPRAITVQEEPISVRVTQQSGTTTKVDCVDAGGLPTWVTTAGTLGSIFGANTINVYVTATDPEGTAVSYQLSTGSLPGGISLSSNGLIQGVATAVTANTTYNFVIKANDTVNNNTDRSFSYTVLNRAPLINTAAGSLGTIYSGNAVPSTTISAYDPDGGTITFSAPTGNIVNTTIGSANGTIVGTPIVVTTNTTYTIGVTVTDEGSLTASNNYTFTVLNRPPVWNTAAELPSANSDYNNSITVNAYDPDGGSVTYSLTSGSLPTGLSFVTANGAIVGAPSDVESNTTSTFTVTATDVGNDANARTFSLTITPSPPDANIASTVLLLRGDMGNTVIKDASSNNNNLTVFGDARASNFNPYNTSWGVYFDGSSRISTTANTAFAYGTGPLTIECWVYPVAYTSTSGYGMGIYTQTTSGQNYFLLDMSSTSWGWSGGHTSYIATNRVLPLHNWTHLAVVREGTGSNQTKLYQNGLLVATGTNSTDLSDTSYNPTIGGYSHSSILDFRGYVSNFRITKSAVYTANFTPSTTSLTTVANTSLLTCQSNRFIDNSNNNFNFTVTGGTPKVVGASPFAETDTSNGSMYFDGSSDYVQLASTNALAYGTGDFTMECWLYLIAAPGSDAGIMEARPSSTNGAYCSLLLNSSRQPFVYINTDVRITGAALKLCEWTHISYSRISGVGTLYINGIRSGSTYSDSTTYIASPMTIGQHNFGGSGINGYICNARIVNGTGVYTANTTPPSAPLTAITNTKLLTLQNRKPHNNKSFQDKSRNKFLFTSYNEITQSSFSPYGPFGWSNYFNGSSGIRFADNAAFQFGTSAFTVEGWFNVPSTPSNDATIISKWVAANDGNSSWMVDFQSSNLSAAISIGGSVTRITGTGGITLGTWNHFALVRSGSPGTLSLFLNGSRIATATPTGSLVDDSNPVGIGVRGGTDSYYLTGYVSNIRVVNGTALYDPTLTSHTVPTTQPTSVTNTKLLTCQSNRFIDNSAANSGSGFTATTVSTPFVYSFSPFSPPISYNPTSNSGSIFCDGSNDYLYNSDPIFDPNYTFTAEGWFYLTSAPGGSSAWIIGQNNNGQFIWVINSSLAVSWGSFNFPSAGSSYGGSTASNAIRIGCWNHLAVVRNGNAWNIYVNGNSANSIASLAATFGYPTNNSLFMNNQINDYGSFPGYISDLRFSQEAIYTGNFTPPTTPLQATSNTRLLLNGTDNTILDSVGKNALVTVADVKANNTIYKFANSAIWFDGSGDYLQMRPLPIQTLPAAFTLEAWIYPVSSGQFRLWGNWNSNTNGYALFLSPSGSYARMYYGNYGSNEGYLTSTMTIPLNTWSHFAVCRDTSSNWYFFLNGTSYGASAGGSIWSNSRSFFNVSDMLFVGDGSYTGAISDLRLTTGLARYTANFTPPTRSFPNR